MPRLDRAAEICDALGLEFYIGPPRNDSAASDPQVNEDVAPYGRSPQRPAADNQTLDELRSGFTGLRNDIREGLSAIEARLEQPKEASTGSESELLTLREHDVPPFAWLGRAAGGAGDPIFGDLTERRYAFHKSIIPDWAQRDSLLSIEVTGDSMQPTINDGDILLVDRSQTEPLSGQIFLVHTPDGLIVKRLRRTKGRWMLISDNGGHKPRPVGPDDRIVGRFVWTGAPP